MSKHVLFCRGISKETKTGVITYFLYFRGSSRFINVVKLIYTKTSCDFVEAIYWDPLQI